MKHHLRYQQVMSFLCAAALSDVIVLSTTPTAYASPLTTSTTVHTIPQTTHSSAASLEKKTTVTQTVILGSDYAPQSSLYTVANHHTFTVQISTPLPDSHDMSTQDTELHITDTPSQGVSMPNPAHDPAALLVAGIPCSQLPGAHITSTIPTSDPILYGGNGHSWTLTLTPEDIHLITQRGTRPASATGDQQTEHHHTGTELLSEHTHISTGENFAITIHGTLNTTHTRKPTNATSVMYTTSHDHQTTTVGTIAHSLISFATFSASMNALNSDGTINTSTHPIYSIGKTITFQLTSTFPDPSTVSLKQSITSLSSYAYSIQITPSAGLTLFNPNIVNGSSSQTTIAQILSTVKIAGIPLSTIVNDNFSLGNTVQGTSVNTTVSGDNQGFYQINLTHSELEYIEQNGTYNGQPITPGQPFTITFQGYEDNAITSSGAYVTAQMGLTSLSLVSWILEGTVAYNWQSNSPYSITPSVTVYPMPESVQPTITQHLLTTKGTIETTSPLTVVTGDPRTLQIESSLPDPTTMRDTCNYFGWTVTPSAGIHIMNAADPTVQSHIMIAGIPLTSLPSVTVTGSNTTSTTITKGESWTISLTAADIHYIEQHGMTPANSTHTQGTTSGISIGSPFALTYQGTLDETVASTGATITAHSWYADTSHSISIKSNTSTLTLTPTAISTPTLQKSVLSTSGMIDNSPAAQRDQTITYQIATPLPEPSTMVGDYQYFVISDTPQTGVSIMNAADPHLQQDITVAGIPLSTLLTMGSTVSGTNSTDPTVVGNGTNSWTIDLSQQAVTYIEQHGKTAATSTTTESSTQGVTPGENIGITYTGSLNTNATTSGLNENEAIDAYAASTADAATRQWTRVSIPSSVSVHLIVPPTVRQLPLTGGHLTPQERNLAIGISVLLIVSGGMIITILYRRHHLTDGQ